MLVVLQGAAAAKVIDGALSMSSGAKRYFAAELGIAKKSRKKKKEIVLFTKLFLEGAVFMLSAF